MKIGVYDSGVGGQSVARAIARAYPQHSVLFMDDTEHMPYGSRPTHELRKLAEAKIADLEAKGCDLIVVACNTISCTVLRDITPHVGVPVVGIVPMIKPAVLATNSGVIAVCATPATLASIRYAELKDEFAKNVLVLEPDCSDWALMIESNSVNESRIKEVVDDVCDKGADVIVLGCTHYHWIHDLINKLAKGRASVIYPEEAIVRRTGYLAEEIARTASKN